MIIETAVIVHDYLNDRKIYNKMRILENHPID